MPLHLHLTGLASGVQLLEMKEDASSFDFPPDLVEVHEPLHLSLRVTRDESMVVVQGRALAVLERTCDRCLGPSRQSVEVELSEVYHLVDRGGQSGEDEDEGVHAIGRQSSRIDLAPAIRTQVLIDLPIRSLCRDDCRGLCPTCGVNRNEQACGCDASGVDPRWDALRRKML